MNTETEDTFQVKIYMSGPIEIAKQLLRQECAREGLCVTIEPTTFIYKGGEETGFVIGLINYPKYPKSHEEIIDRAKKIVNILLEGTFQDSALLMTPSKTTWISKRGK